MSHRALGSQFDEQPTELSRQYQTMYPRESAGMTHPQMHAEMNRLNTSVAHAIQNQHAMVGNAGPGKHLHLLEKHGFSGDFSNPLPGPSSVTYTKTQVGNNVVMRAGERVEHGPAAPQAAAPAAPQGGSTTYQRHSSGEMRPVMRDGVPVVQSHSEIGGTSHYFRSAAGPHIKLAERADVAKRRLGWKR